ncbi:uncharacterized protein N0V89_010648 [Didymosphaeria variabile]|uniref:NAD-dependent epimerase/dehydratase domain-containing protein n=1 Tax=Didymosphaeria variabile TaxID=1932322 RepID=A0A9W9C6C1_9PLEO|nr:uncharacterized protein N0V89_010648 [Didymosphaeria variabile]KAJ4346716.1 hypothetical protein N0V89_010648 [Didymosphaeria variabile]
MKVLITGATGTIGSAILRHCLQNPSITSVVALSRRPLPQDITSSKLSTIIVSDFANYDASLLSQILSADAAIWAMGTTDANREVNVVYPHAFFTAFLDARKDSQYRSQRFRYIRVNGAFTESDQNRPLWFYSEPRKLHGMSEARTLELGEQYHDVCQTFVVKPGGVATQGAWAMECVGKMLGDGMVIGQETLGAFVADLVVHGEEEEVFSRPLQLILNGLGSVGVIKANVTVVESGTELKPSDLEDTLELSGDELPQVSADGSGTLSGTYHIVAGDGAGPIYAVIYTTASGKFSEGIEAEVTQNVPGNRGRIRAGGYVPYSFPKRSLRRCAPVVNLDYPFTVAVPKDIDCKGRVAGKMGVCFIKISNLNHNGPFGGTIAFQIPDRV